MTTISSDIRNLIKNEFYANPFHIDFDLQKLVDQVDETQLNEDETNLLGFLHLCNNVFIGYRAQIFSIFDSLRFSQEDLREFLFIGVNRYYLDLIPLIFQPNEKTRFFDSEKIPFTKLVLANGSEGMAQFAIEIGGDILAELITYSYQWKRELTTFNSLSDLEAEAHGHLFHKLWAYTNIFCNIKDAYESMRHEDSQVIIRSQSKIKIESRIAAIPFLKTIGMVRMNSSMQEIYFNTFSSSGKDLKKSVGADDILIKENTLSMNQKKWNKSAETNSNPNVLLFYPHFITIGLDFFDGLMIPDLLQIASLIQECTDQIKHEYMFGPSKQLTSFEETPIKFRESELVKSMCEMTNYSTELISKLIDSLVTDEQAPYFWKKPFLRSGDFLYFPLNAITSPNHSLYIDTWLWLSGYTNDLQEVIFTDFVKKRLSEDRSDSYKFDIVDISAFELDSDFSNSILIETNALFILLEVKVFDFPIESSEMSGSLFRLGNATQNLDRKTKIILPYIDQNKEIVQLILTTHMHFSGLTLNNISICDWSLFRNYVIAGSIGRAAVSIEEGQYVTTESPRVDYYQNEHDFNQNLKSFFINPVPIQNILQRLQIKEIPVTPNGMEPTLMIDITDHITDEELTHHQIDDTTRLLNYEYFAEPEEKLKATLDQSILFSLTQVFNRLSSSNYEASADRIRLYHEISHTRNLGFSHLTMFMLDALDRLKNKPVAKLSYFESIEYTSQEIDEILEKVNLSGGIRLATYTIEEDLLSSDQEQKLLSFSIDMMSGITHKHFNEEILQTLFVPLVIVNGLSSKYEVDYEFYSACNNIVEGLNHSHKYQLARDFCEEILVLSINRNKHHYAWNLLFRCYSQQKNNFEAALNGCLFLSSLSNLSILPYGLAVEAVYESLKFYRNFGLPNLAKYVYSNAQYFQLNEYDEQKIALGYFNCLFKMKKEHQNVLLDSIENYLKHKIELIISFRDKGVLPWLAFLYNLEHFRTFSAFSYIGDLTVYTSKLEEVAGTENIKIIKSKIFGEHSDPKVNFISVLLKSLETRSVLDFIHESQQLSAITSNLIQTSLKLKDPEGLLLAGLIRNDQSFSFIETYVENGTLSPVDQPINQELNERLNNYQRYLLNKINLKTGQLFIWLFEDLGKAYLLTIDSEKRIETTNLENWSIAEMDSFVDQIGNFYFNAKKDSEGNPRSEFSNPRGERDYNDLVQKEDYKSLQSFLAFSNLPLSTDFDELFFSSSIDMSDFPHNLIELNHDFIGAQKPICNVISIEHFVERDTHYELPNDFSVSAWIPINDEEPTISWGFEKLKPMLDRIKATISTTTYPETPLTTDLNIFLAHGVTDSSGFKAIYTNHTDKIAIASPFKVFGTGKVAILFICNSGSSKEAQFSNNIISFSGELLKSGYESVVAPFWPFDVTMCKLWLEEFLLVFNDGFSINQSVWLANNKLSKYDEESSNMYFAPAGRLAMHLYGNPNVTVKQMK